MKYVPNSTIWLANQIAAFSIGLGDIEFVTCDYCMNYLLQLLQYCMQKTEAQPHSLKSL